MLRKHAQVMQTTVGAPAEGMHASRKGRFPDDDTARRYVSGETPRATRPVQVQRQAHHPQRRMVITLTRLGLPDDPPQGIHGVRKARCASQCRQKMECIGMPETGATLLSGRVSGITHNEAARVHCCRRAEEVWCPRRPQVTHPIMHGPDKGVGTIGPRLRHTLEEELRIAHDAPCLNSIRTSPGSRERLGSRQQERGLLLRGKRGPYDRARIVHTHGQHRAEIREDIACRGNCPY